MKKLWEDLRKHINKAWLLGVILGLLCHFAPPEYHEACKTLLRACTP